MRKTGFTGWVPIALLLLLTACLLVLFGIVQNSSTQSRLAAQHAVVSKGAREARERNLTAETAAIMAQHSQLMQQMHKQLQEQLQEQVQQHVSALNQSIPHLLKHALHEHAQTKAAAAAPAAPPPQQPQQQTSQEQQPQPKQPLAVPGHDVVHHVAKARAACDKQGGGGLKLDVADKRLVAPVVIVAHDRVHYLAKCLMNVLRYWSADESNNKRFPLFVSIDGGHEATSFFAAALNYGAEVQVVHNQRDHSRCKPRDGYCNLSLHYQMLLQLFLECLDAPRVLFLEEDLEIAPDFFSYFSALAPVLEADKSILCISAWNDHGQHGRASNRTALYRTDIFPGLGWMTTAGIGREVYPGWPDFYWDEYMREPKVRKGRQCVFPEVSRTHTFGKVGTSGGQFFDTQLAGMMLNQEGIDWSKQDLSYITKDSYAKLMAGWIQAAEPLPRDGLGDRCRLGGPDDPDTQRDLVVRYTDDKDFHSLAKQLPPMHTDVKGHPEKLPRASYNGITMVRCRGRRLFFAPKQLQQQQQQPEQQQPPKQPPDEKQPDQ